MESGTEQIVPPLAEEPLPTVSCREGSGEGREEEREGREGEREGREIDRHTETQRCTQSETGRQKETERQLGSMHTYTSMNK